MPLEQAPSPPQGAPGAHAPGRAGRNLPAAVGVAVVLAALILLSLFTVRAGFVAVVLAATALGIFEMTRAVGVVEARPPLVPLCASGAAMLVAAWYGGAAALLAGLLLTVLLLLAWRLADGPVSYLRDVVTGVFVATYVPFLAGFAVLLAVPDDGALRVTAFIATVVCSDVGGYAAGVFLGRHPMAPTVSPKKSWEGFAGSALACVAGGVAFLVLGFDATVGQGVAFGLATAVAATLGDLGESMIKRDLGIKDMGTILPGHGGLMDRLDSLLLTAPVAWLLLSAFAPPG